MGLFNWLRRNNTAPQETRAVSPTVSAMLYSPGLSMTGFWKKRGHFESFDDAAKEGYGKNAIAYTAVDEVAKAVASAPWLAYRRTALEREEIPKPPVFLRPNPFQGWPDFIYAATSYHRIAGEVPIEAITPTGSYNEPPIQLYLHVPGTVEPMFGPLGLAAYGIRTPSGLVRKWPVDPVTGQSNMRLLKTFNPSDPWRGLSPIAAAELSISLHNDANLWNANLLKRGASSDILMTVKGAMSDKSLSRMKQQMEEDMSGAQNVKAVTILDAMGDGVNIEKINFSPRDMSWIEGINTSGHQVAIAIGGSTMPFLLGLPGLTTFSNQKEARLAFWDTFIIPLLHMTFRDEFNAWLMPRYGEGLELDVDLDEVPALEPRREAKWDRLEQSTMLSLNEKREALGYDPVQQPGADVPVALLPYAMTPQGVTNNEEETEEEQEQNQQKWEKELIDSGLAPEFAKGMRNLTFLNGKNGTVH